MARLVLYLMFICLPLSLSCGGRTALTTRRSRTTPADGGVVRDTSQRDAVYKDAWLPDFYFADDWGYFDDDGGYFDDGGWVPKDASPRDHRVVADAVPRVDTWSPTTELVFYSHACGPGAHSGGGYQQLWLPAHYTRVVLEKACFDDRGYVQIQGTTIYRYDDGCCGAGCHEGLQVDVTHLVHSGQNEIYGYADDCCGNCAHASAVFRIL